MKSLKSTLFLVFILSFFSSNIAKAQTLEQFQVLIYTSSDKWHDATLPSAMLAFRGMAKKHTFGLTWTQQPTNFTDAFLEKFDVIVFLHSRGFDLSSEQMACFKRFIRNGGGFVGIHAAAANEGQVEWFQKLIGRKFTDHPEVQTAVLNVINKGFPATMHLPDYWVRTDEWYAFDKELTKNIRYLISVDESSYDPNRTWGDANRFTEMGDFHPISWFQVFDGGRSFYTAMGHLPASYEDSSFLDHIYGGIYWAATGFGFIEK